MKILQSKKKICSSKSLEYLIPERRYGKRLVFKINVHECEVFSRDDLTLPSNSKIDFGLFDFVNLSFHNLMRIGMW